MFARSSSLLASITSPVKTRAAAALAVAAEVPPSPPVAISAAPDVPRSPAQAVADGRRLPARAAQCEPLRPIELFCRDVQPGSTPQQARRAFSKLDADTVQGLRDQAVIEAAPAALIEESVKLTPAAAASSRNVRRNIRRLLRQRVTASLRRAQTIASKKNKKDAKTADTAASETMTPTKPLALPIAGGRALPPRQYRLTTHAQRCVKGLMDKMTAAEFAALAPLAAAHEALRIRREFFARIAVATRTGGASSASATEAASQKTKRMARPQKRLVKRRGGKKGTVSKKTGSVSIKAIRSTKRRAAPAAQQK